MAKTTIPAGYIAANAITATEIAANAITAAAIATDAISADIADNAITSAKIAKNAVGTAEIATNAVGADQISPNAVKASELASDALSGQNFTGNVTFDTNVLYVDSTNNRVGVGTASPDVLLDVSGATPTIRVVGTSASNPSLTLSSAGVTAYSFVTSGTDSSFSLKKDGSLRIHIDSPGNVGIGKVPNRSRFLEVAGTMNLDDGYEYEWGDGSISIAGNSSTDVMTFNTAGVEAMRIQSDRALKLSERIILGSFTHGVTNSGEALIGKAGDRTGGTMTIQLGGTSATGTKWEIVNRAWTKVIAQISGEAPENSLVVNTSGYVGIGTGTPEDQLHIYGAGTSSRGLQITATDSSGYAEAQFVADSREWRIGSGGSAGSFPNMFYIYDQGSGYGRLLIDPATGDVRLVGGHQMTNALSWWNGTSYELASIENVSHPSYNDSGGLLFKTAGTSSAGMIERMRIDSAGRITMPYQPAFCVANPPGTYPVAGNFGKSDNPTAGSSYTIHVNQGSHFSTSTGRFTAPIAGKYYFSFSAMFDQNSSSNPGFDFKVNGTSAYGGEGVDGGTDSYMQLAGSILLDLSANDYVELNIRGSRVHQRYGSFEGFLVA